MARMAKSNGGFTLVEMIMVIVITGVLAAMVAVFLQSPVQGYLDASRRAALTDVADVALGTITRELRRALPNSVRVSTDGLALEFVPTLAAGRYEQLSSANCFSSLKCASLKTLGTISATASQYAGKSLVIFNYYNNAGGSCTAASLPSVYCGQNSALIQASAFAGGQETFSFATAVQFFPSGGSPVSRFQVVDTPVSYVCVPSGGVLRRYWGYPLHAVQTSSPGGSSAILGNGIPSGGCGFQYQAGTFQRLGVVAIGLTVSDSGESVHLYQEVHVNNAP